MTPSSEAKIEIAQEFEAPVAQEAPQKFVREIEVGGRIQKFEAETYEALVDKLVEAQTNATKKLQELATQRRGRIEPEKKSSDYQPLQPMHLKEEELEQLPPQEMVRRIFQAEAGMSLEEFRMRESERRRIEAEYRVQNEFVQRHPDYVATPENGQKILKFLQEQGYPISKANLDYAFEELRGELSQSHSQPATQPLPAGSPQGHSTAPPSSAPPSFVRPSLGGRVPTDDGGGIDVNAEAARIAQLSPAEAKARIESLWRQSRSAR